MFANRQQIIEHYRNALAVNDKQGICCNPLFPEDEIPKEIAFHSFSILLPLRYHKVELNDRILDIGCGAGADCFLAAYRGGPQNKIIGIDIVEELIARANSLKQKYDMQTIEFLMAAVPPLPFMGSCFDLVLMNYSFHLFEDKRQILEEIQRVLVTGGTAIVADSFTPKDRYSSAEIENWLLSASGAVSADDFVAIANAVHLKVSDFMQEDLPHLPKDEIIGYMICRKEI